MNLNLQSSEMRFSFLSAVSRILIEPNYYTAVVIVEVELHSCDPALVLELLQQQKV